MTAKDIDALVTGMTIRGNRAVDNQPFAMIMNPDKTVAYEFARTGALSGTVERLTGKWYSEDHRFCLQVDFFAMGRKLCPIIIKEGDKLFAQRRRDGVRVPWSLSKR